jgi:hypothetical protein
MSAYLPKVWRYKTFLPSQSRLPCHATYGATVIVGSILAVGKLGVLLVGIGWNQCRCRLVVGILSRTWRESGAALHD